MNAFDLTRTQPGGIEILEWREGAEHRNWDTLRVSVAARMTPSAFKTRFPEGRTLPVGLGMVIERSDATSGPNGWCEGELGLRGLFRAKRWGRLLGDTADFVYNFVDIVENGVQSTINRLNYLEVVPSFEVVAFDQWPPDQRALGKKATTPYAGLSFPPEYSPASGPFTFWGDYIPTVQRPFGWVLAQIDSEELGNTTRLYRKMLRYVWRWPLVP